MTTDEIRLWAIDEHGVGHIVAMRSIVSFTVCRLLEQFPRYARKMPAAICRTCGETARDQPSRRTKPASESDDGQRLLFE